MCASVRVAGKGGGRRDMNTRSDADFAAGVVGKAMEVLDREGIALDDLLAGLATAMGEAAAKAGMSRAEALAMVAEAHRRAVGGAMTDIVCIASA